MRQLAEHGHRNFPHTFWGYRDRMPFVGDVYTIDKNFFYEILIILHSAIKLNISSYVNASTILSERLHKWHIL